ncbi:GNAT family N-acetyltransferase [Celerinatantimonas sp. YJH-8]|uniref:GNAT family N-acetyltransferase n=1 Tax=Celerinatantimonas sp. YJH-8 TaxID=3228714 RepID=UPI0038C0C8AA
MQIHKVIKEQVIPIRHQVLWPDKPVEFCCLEEDAQGIHWGVFLEDRLVCVASIYVERDEARLRKFATLPEFQRQGIGSALIRHIIEVLHQLPVSRLWCDARESACAFYQGLGFTRCSDCFYKSDVAYYQMEMVIGLS